MIQKLEVDPTVGRFGHEISGLELRSHEDCDRAYRESVPWSERHPYVTQAGRIALVLGGLGVLSVMGYFADKINAG